MIKKVLAMAALGMLLSGCFMAPLALIGPATSGFSTASLIQSAATSTVNHMIKKSTGKTVTEHALDALTISSLKQSYFPKEKKTNLIK